MGTSFVKKLGTYVFLVVAALAAAFVAWYWLKSSAERADAARPVATRQVTVSGSGNPEEAPGGSKAPAENANKIGALPDEVVLSVESLNLDTDEGEEQILTVRKTSPQYTGLALVVADWVPDRRQWIRSWEGRIPVTKLTTLQIQARDLIGDHWLDIVATGMDERNEQTLTVFREVRKSEFTGLIYTEIAGIAADSVFIDAVDRPESYQLAQTDGEPFRILSFVGDRKSANPLDTTRTTWTWEARKGKYAPTATDRIPGAQVAKELATKVLTGQAADFEKFLTGVWYDDELGPHDPRTRLIVFDPPGASIIFFSGDSQEVFRWNESHSTYNGLYAGTNNESVQNLRRLLDIEMTGADTISLRVFEDLLMKIDSENRWDGSYRRLVNDPRLSQAPGPLPRLEGSWTGGGQEFSFAGGRYTWSKAGELRRGRYLLYSVGPDPVIELLAEGAVAGAKPTRSDYLIAIPAAKDGKRRLSLIPVTPTINGLERKEEGTFELEFRPPR